MHAENWNCTVRRQAAGWPVFMQVSEFCRFFLLRTSGTYSSRKTTFLILTTFQSRRADDWQVSALSCSSKPQVPSRHQADVKTQLTPEMSGFQGQPRARFYNLLQKIVRLKISAHFCDQKADWYTTLGGRLRISHLWTYFSRTAHSMCYVYSRILSFH